LAAGSDKATALAEAQRGLLAARRQAHKSTHPFFWAAFTLTGDWRIPEVAPAEVRPPRRAAVELVEIVAETTRVMDGEKIVAQMSRGERLVRGQTNGAWIQVFYQPGSQRSGWILGSDVQAVK
jgi:CHAT domain